jgi:hypothetical protein
MEFGPVAPETVPAAAVGNLTRAGVPQPRADEAEAGYRLETHRLMRMKPAARWVGGSLAEVMRMLYEAHLSRKAGA